MHGPHGPQGPDRPQRHKHFWGEDALLPPPPGAPGPPGGPRHPWDERPGPPGHPWDERPGPPEPPWDEQPPPFPPGPPGFAGPPGPPGPPSPPGMPGMAGFVPPDRAFTRPGPPFGGWFGRGGGGGRPKVGRGDVRAAILLLLYEEPRNGYQIITEIEQRSNGVWRPSPGSVYPALSQLEDEGLVATDESSGRKLFTLTDSGRTHVEEQGIEPPWNTIAGSVDDDVAELHSIIGQVSMAAMQVARVGSDVSRARRVLVDARRQLYRILAEDDEADQG